MLEAQRLVAAARGRPRLEIVQASLIQVFYLLMTCRMNQAWYTFGGVLQLIAALGLHRLRNSAQAAHDEDYVKTQCCKRTFWTAYILDRYIGVTMGRPNHFHDEDIQIDLPDCVNDNAIRVAGPQEESDSDCEIIAFVLNAKLARIVGKISQRLYASSSDDRDQLATMLDFNAELDEWQTRLPAFLSTVKPSSLIRTFRRQQIALKVAHCHCRIHLNRIAVLDTGKHRESSTMKHCARLCIAAAADVVKIVDDMARDGPLFHAFWWTHYVAFCALSAFHVWEVQGDKSILPEPDLERLRGLAERCHAHLAKATATNSPSRRYSIILEELRHQAIRSRAPAPLETREAIDESGGCASATPRLDQALNHEEPVVDTFELHDVFAGWQPSDWLDLDASVGTQCKDDERKLTTDQAFDMHTDLNWLSPPD